MVLWGVLCAAPAAGQDAEISDFEELDLEELLDVNVYTAAKHRQDIAESPSAISVITRDQIENTACTDVVCLLRQVPEVDVIRITPMYSAIGARALTDALGDKVLVMVDEREINDEVFGTIYWQALPVHLEDIERIEVIRGPVSALYGANAHSLVVSIATRKISDRTAEAFLGSGEHGRSSLHLRLGQRLGGWHLQVSGGIDTAENWRLQGRREREVGRVRLRMDHQGEWGDTVAQLGLVYGQGLFYTPIGNANIYDAYRGYVFWGHQMGMLKTKLSFGFTDAGASWDLPLYYHGIKLGEPPDFFNVFSSNLDGEAQITWSPFEGNFWIAGANYRWITLFMDKNEPGEIHQHRVGLFLHNEQRLVERVTVTLGVRFDYNNITPFTISPRVACVWRAVDRHFLRLAVGQAFRKPSFFNTSLHIKGIDTEPGFEALADFFLDNIGNEDLENESITTVEGGYNGRFLNKRLGAEVVMFYSRFRDTIATYPYMAVDQYGMPDPANSVMKFENAGREVDSLGGSISLTWRIRRALQVGVNYTARYSWYVSKPHEAAGISYELERGDRVPWEPVHQFNAMIQHVPERGIRLGLALYGRSHSDMDRLEHGGLFDDRVQLHNPAMYLLSGFAAWREVMGPGWLELGIRAYNFFNTGFRDSMAVRRLDGTEVGGELIGRRIFLFLRGSI